LAVDQTQIVVAIPVSVALAVVAVVSVWLKRRNGKEKQNG
jgi:hypothetical protein